MMSLSSSVSSVNGNDNNNNEHSLIAASSRILQGVLHSIFTSTTNYWQRLFMTTVVPLGASTIWYFSRTVIQVMDEEQALWVQLWLSTQTAALSRVRHLCLLPAIARSAAGSARRYRRQMRDIEEEEDTEEGGGRFAPPKLDFQPNAGVVTWTLVHGWPVSVSSIASGAGNRDPYSGMPVAGGTGYTLTVWFAPFGRSIAKNLLFQGRDLWLARRAKKTEIWMPHRRNGNFKVVTRPSRPLSSVIVEGDTKECLRHDAIHFLNSEQWYISKGIPYRRGYLLYGPPGNGKTSLITALAGDLRMPIVVVPLNDQHMDDSTLMQSLGDAPKNSLVLLEDIDCALPKDTSQRAAASIRNRYGGTPVTLSGLLNAIDGVGAQEGRLLFMTTNHIDRLDDALIRPGRVDCKFHLDKASKTGAGELFDQFFAAPDTKKSMISGPMQAIKQDFLCKVDDGEHSFAALQGVFMSAKDDPALVSAGMDRLVASDGTGQDPKKDSAYDKVMKIEKALNDAQEKERKDEESQRKAGKTVMKRLVGNPVHTNHTTQLQQIVFCGCFPTFGAPDKLTTSGVLYFEIEVIKAHSNIQVGFSLKDGLPLSELDTGEGVGDNETSWAVDGIRQRLWHGGNDAAWDGLWTEGCVLGLAANMDVGSVAVSKDGDWGIDGSLVGYGVVFRNASIKEGVFPAITASHHTVRYHFEADETLKYGPPPKSVWFTD